MDRLAAMLLRHGRVAPSLLAREPAPELPGGTPEWLRGRALNHAPAPADGLLALESDLFELGFVLSAPLRRRLAAMDAGELPAVGRALLGGLLARLGGAVDHVPLFRGFPRSVPADTFELYVRRVFSVLLQEPEQPCVLCGRVATVHPVAPCAHLVCRACWDGADYSACPICHRRLDPADPFLRPASEPPADARPPVDPRRRTLLSLCEDPMEEAGAIVRAVLTRQSPPRPEDRDEVLAALDAHWPAAPSWLPEAIPVRETRAAVLAVALRHDPAGFAELLDRHAGTATDVLRVLYAAMGGDPGLRTRPPRRTTLPRPLRRTLLAALDRLSLPLLVEDLERHRAAWVHMAEVLHPHEHHRRFPTAALAFAALRGTPLGTGTPFARAMLDHAAGHPGVLAFDGVRLRPVTFARRIESALRAGDLPAALALLRTRPGELARRLAHLARLADGPDAAAALAAAVTEAAPRVSPAVLVAALGRLRTAPGGARLFFPRGGAAKAMSVLDERPPIPAATVAAVSGAIEAEMLRRAAALPPLRLALLDEGLTDLLAPAAERSASAALVRIPRGSVQPIPGGERIRLFLHWADSPDERVDLDLSVAVFDERWRFVGLCDYTNLTLGPRAAVHSGDLTSAPEPLGSSEFVDLDVRAVRRLGGRYVLPTVLSYNDVPFERLARGFAGFMETPPGQFGEDGGDGEAFDARAVRQRFDLAGPAKVLLPLVADLWSRTMRWTDVNLGVSGEIHDIDRHARSLARLASAMEDVYGLGDHVTLWELARWHAAARAEEVLIRHRDGTTTLHRRTPGEPPAAFAARLTPLPSPAPAPTGDTPLPDFAALVTADVPLAPGAQVYALYPALLDPTTTTLLDAADLLTPLTPATQLTPA